MSPQMKRKWEPHPGQRAVMESSARFRVVTCGRRWGKTEMAAHEAIEFAYENAGADIWWVAPTYQQANDFGYARIISALPGAAIESKNRSMPRSITLTNGATISFRSSEREDSLRGAGLDLLIIDEAGSVPDHRWSEELRPTLIDTKGSMLAIGTPKGKNWFHTYYGRGQDPEDTEVESWQSSSYDNIYLDEDEIEQTRAEMSEREFDQEILAKFIDEAGGVFTNVRGCIARDPPDADPDDESAFIGPDLYFAGPANGGPRFEGPYTIGVDLARTQNFSVTTALDKHGRLCAFERLNDTSWSVIQNSIERVAEEFSPHTCYIDATRDNKIIQDLESEGVTIEPVRFSASKKSELVENLAVRLEQNDITYPEIPELINELELFEYELSPAGNVTYGAPDGCHDDIVDSLALAAQQSNITYATW